ncbi:hypothetical protein [Xanthomonas sp. XNM01]|uniref:hypothetical protein n=1 Tax=Xanthomonas sp. XNM01 TaxID=2769289 RepID=UPI001781160B|nr:hypothetical protein [Xanthomonas sp. XNM01]MBD9370380.1 hypothetical protein [Xanthomonas sp. XNM01]
MRWSEFVRWAHRWLSMAFTVTVVANIIAVASGRQVEWLYMLPLVPLSLLVPSGLYMFFQPWLRKRSAQEPGRDGAGP